VRACVRARARVRACVLNVCMCVRVCDARVEGGLNGRKAEVDAQWRIHHCANWAMAIYFSFFDLFGSHGLYIFELFDVLNWQRESAHNRLTHLLIYYLVLEL